MNAPSVSERPACHPARMPRLLVAGLLTAAVVATNLGVGAGSAADAASASPTMSADRYESRVQYWVNRRRGAHDLPALRLARCTDRAAERWGSYLAANDEFYHQSMQRLLVRCDARYAGETLGRGSISPRRLVRLWMESPGHRAILLSGKARRIGVGASPDAQGRWVVAADFMRF